MATKTTRTVILFKAAEGMPAGQMARELAGKGKHPLIVAMNQLLADALTEAMTTAADAKIQADTHAVAHALGAVDVTSQLRAHLADLTAQTAEDAG